MTEEQLLNIFEQVKDAWGFEGKVETAVINKDDYYDIEDAGAITFFKEKWLEKFDIVFFNEILLDLDDINIILMICYHELAHLITRKKDDDIEFYIFCKLNNIIMNDEKEWGI